MKLRLLLPLLPYVAVALGLALAVGALVRWWEGNNRADLVRDLLNAEAGRDSLRIVATAADSSVRVYERQARIATGEKDLLAGELAEEREARERAQLEARAAYAVAISYRNRLAGETRLVADNDSTRIPFALSDGSLEARGEVSFPGTVTPDPTPPAHVTLEVALRELELRVRTLVDPETCAPFTQVTTSDSRVRVTKVESVVDERLTCIERPGFLGVSVVAGGVGAAIGGGIGFLLGAALSGP